MKKINLLFCFVAAAFLISCKSETKPQKPAQTDIIWISSDAASQWNLANIPTEKTEQADIVISSANTLQTIDGFGGCFNELGWEALNIVSKAEKDKILDDIFNPEQGAKFNLCRMPIGANDYAVDWYSHNEIPGDFAMENFSLERDMQRLIPYIHAAQAINPEIKIWGSPWCPPSWMKTNKHYACRPDTVNDLTAEGEGEEMVTQFIMEEDYLNSYALYFSKFIQEYKKHDITISAAHVQNEPNSCQNFPSCVWNPKDLANFIGGYLGPKFEADNIDAEIWLGTIERPQFERVQTVLEDENASQYITGVGFQWAGKGAIPEVHQNYPNLKLMQTETECGDGSNDWAAAEYTFGLMKHYFNNGANAYLYWNIVLDETGKSQWGWKQNSMISIDRESKSITYNPEFYLMKHFSAYIKPGAQFIKSNDENCLAFKNEKEVVVIFYNDKEEDATREFAVDDYTFKGILKAKSFNTFVVPTI